MPILPILVLTLVLVQKERFGLWALVIETNVFRSLVGRMSKFESPFHPSKTLRSKFCTRLWLYPGPPSAKSSSTSFGVPGIFYYNFLSFDESFRRLLNVVALSLSASAVLVVVYLFQAARKSLAHIKVTLVSDLLSLVSLQCHYWPFLRQNLLADVSCWACQTTNWLHFLWPWKLLGALTAWRWCRNPSFGSPFS